MKTQRKIWIAFVLNLTFSAFEFFGGIAAGSVAIVSDAIHDLGDAISIGIAYFLERKSRRPPDDTHTYGYGRYSVMGGLITTLILIVGSVVMIYNAIIRIIHPAEIHHHRMLVIALFGVVVNLGAAFLTREGGSLNQKAVNLHMLEDVLGWLVVLVGAIVIRFTNFTLIDPLMSIGVSVFILIHALKNLKDITDVLLEKSPCGINVGEIQKHVSEAEGILDVYHVHVWSIDGQCHCATMHVVTDKDPQIVKENVEKTLHEHGILHTTIEWETDSTICRKRQCSIQAHTHPTHSHHHSH